MSQYVEISDNNYSGQTAQVTFNSLAGGAYDLGEQVVPFTFYGDTISPGFSVYGEYVLYYIRFYKTCTINVLPVTTTTTIPVTTTTTQPTTTTTTSPLICDIDYDLNFVPNNTEITFISNITPGSVNAEYNLITNNPLDYDLTLSFTQILGTITGDGLTINSEVTIPTGNLTGTTLVVIDYDYNNLNDTSEFTGFNFSPTDINVGFNFSSETIFTPVVTETPTPTLTETPTSTPTPTLTETPTITLTPTLTETPSLTPSPTITTTPTLTETPTSTPTPTLTETPTNTPTPTLTETPTLTPSSTITPTPTLTETPTPTPTLTETPILTPSSTNTSPVSDNFTWSFDDQTTEESNNYTIILNSTAVVNTNSTRSGSFKVSDKDVVRIIMTIIDGNTGSSILEEDSITIYQGILNRTPETLDSGGISIVEGSTYIATGIITSR